jgi:hypothetical protein
LSSVISLGLEVEIIVYPIHINTDTIIPTVPTMVNFIKSKSKFEANNRYIYIKKNSGGTIKRKIPVGLLFFIIIRKPI